MKISHGLVPPDGWAYEIGAYTIKGNSFDDLLQNVRWHMINNKIPFCDLESNIEDQVAKKFPHLVIQHGS